MGVNVGEYRIALDCAEATANVNFVSHAHYDHLSGIRKSRKVIASKATKDLIECRYAKKQVTLLDESIKVELLNAGHILGSKQLYAESEELGASVIYSGDFQMQKSYVAEPIETKKADILIIDSTYPEKDFAFGEKSEVISAIQRYALARLNSGIVLFGAYALGKSQELVKIANEVGIAPIVDEKIFNINKVYQKHGIGLDYVSASKDENEFKSATQGNFLAITEPSRLAEMAYNLGRIHRKRVYTAVATGFASVFQLGTDAQFSLSDHADFKQSIDYIEECSPKAIYTRGPEESAKCFAANLREEGYNASQFTGSISVETLILKDR